MAQKFKGKNPKVHPVDLAFAGNSTESVKFAAVDPSGESAGFSSPPIAPGDPENLAGQRYAEALFDGSALPGLDVYSGHGLKTKHSGEYADADRPHRERANRHGSGLGEPYGRGRIERKG